jgi:hypothetical protein
MFWFTLFLLGLTIGLYIHTKDTGYIPLMILSAWVFGCLSSRLFDDSYIARAQNQMVKPDER